MNLGFAVLELLLLAISSGISPYVLRVFFLNLLFYLIITK